MINFKLSLCQVILALIGLHFEVLVFDVLLAPPNEELALATANGFPTDQTTVADLKHLLRVLNSTRITSPHYVGLLLGMHFVARHLFPPCDGMLLLRAILAQFHYSGLLLYTCDEFHLNVMAGALYGSWWGLLLCCALTTVAAAISLATITLVLRTFDQVREDNAGNRRLAVEERARFIAEVLPPNEAEPNWLLEAQLAADVAEQNENREMVQEILQESVPVALAAMFIVRFFPFVPSWLLSLVFGVLGVPAHLALFAIGLGYVPYAWHCVSVARQLDSMDTFAEVYNTRWFHWLIFAGSTVVMLRTVIAMWEDARQRAGVRDEDVFGDEDDEEDNGHFDDDFD